jgi:hypothetical protein
MDAWLAHLNAIQSVRPATRTVVGRSVEAPKVPFQSHLNEAMSARSSAVPTHAAWGELYLREAGLMMSAPAVPVLDDEDAPLAPKTIDPTHRA